MSLAPDIHSLNIVGNFVEKEYGKNFDYSVAESTPFDGFNFKIWLDDGKTFRYANVKSTVAYIVIDEDGYGSPVVDKWNIKQHRVFAK